MTSKIKLGLERTSRLLQGLGNPQKSFEVIHVAGTNGKGSVSAMIANTLSRAGFKTGLYTSPHLAHRWDCIQLNNRAVDYSQFALTEKTVEAESQILKSAMAGKDSSDFEVSSFEQLTATAFKVFQESEVEIAVIEVGLGGTHDATNVVDPVLSVIMAIGIDHTDFLGKTVQDIAKAKAGIIKSGVPVVVTSDQEHGEVFGVLGHVQRQVNPGVKLRWTPPNSTLDFRTSNRNTAREALQCLRDQCDSRLHERLASLTDEFIEHGISTTHWRGRCEHINLELLGGPKEALLDGAHNQQSIDALLATFTEESTRPRTYIFAMTNGKSATALASMLRPGDKFCTVEFERVDGMEWISPMPSDVLLKQLSQRVPDARGIDCGRDILQAIRTTVETHRDSKVVICGSLYLVGQIHRLLEAANYECQVFPDEPTAYKTLPQYDASTVEHKIQQYWQGLPPMNPAAVLVGAKSSMKFLLPPPNVTGSLHIGHALTLAIQDAYCRFYRSQGHDVSWVPGIDHAGIATQSIVTKQLAKQGRNTVDMSRTDFIDHIWRWKERFGSVIGTQMRRLGTSLDWSQEYFTLDENRKAAVVEAVRRLWDAGLIKREKKMVNWSIGAQSVISDIEVSKRAIEGPTTIHGVEYGRMWRIRFELVETEGNTKNRFVEVDTTRPETIFGDRALAVHPDDDRYKNLIGLQVKHPLLQDVQLTIIADTFVKTDFGTGCVKITPAHNPDDYAMSLRHANIPQIAVFGQDGKMVRIQGHPDLEGMDRLSARARIIQSLNDCGALVSAQPHKTTLDMCSRTDTVIEPLLLPQWYISIAPLVDKVMVTDNIRMTDSTRKEWTRWLEVAQDWCVSRQLVWGHRIPLYRVVEDGDHWVFGTDEADAIKNAGGKQVEQDPDVLDTWFSSSLLPLSAFGWPSVQLAPNHSLELIESGPDILFFWLVRMAFMCTFLSGSSPFKEIVLHPLIRDAQGRKMSKSLGNVIDPMTLMEGQSLPSILENLKAGNLDSAELVRATKEFSQTYPQGIRPFGADSVRFALVQSTIQAEALKFDIRAVEAARYLCTKLWNAVNFYQFNMAKLPSILEQDCTTVSDELSLVDSWIIQRVDVAQRQYEVGFMERDLSTSTIVLRNLLVDQVCDVYLEFLKITLQRSQNTDISASRLGLLRSILERIIQMLAPFMPHITEELWHVLGNRSSIHRQIMFGPIEIALKHEHRVDERMECIMDVLKSLRTVNDRPRADVTLHIKQSSEADADLQAYSMHLERIAGLKSLKVSYDGPQENVAITHVSSELAYTISHETPSTRPGMTPGAQKRMQRKVEQLREQISKPEYRSRVPAAVQMKHQQEIQDLERKLQHSIC